MRKLVNVLEKVGKHSPGIASKYAKRLLEPVYDRLFCTRLGRYFKSLSSPKKHAVEASMYIATEFLEQRLQGDTPLGHIAREVVVDTAPEIAKRMVNGPEPAEQKPLPPEDVEKGNQHTVVALMTNDIRTLRQKLRH